MRHYGVKLVLLKIIAFFMIRPKSLQKLYLCQLIRKSQQIMAGYKTYDGLNLPSIDREIAEFWEKNEVFKKSVENRPTDKSFVFYEGPPSANGKPGIHHVMARTVKDLFCRFQTMNGHRVERKGGWDTHGLPVELKVEKELGITKEDIGSKISVDDYNKACRETVMRFKDMWDDITVKMGYWVDLDNPYITFDNEYICLLYTSPSPRDRTRSRMPSSA